MNSNIALVAAAHAISLFVITFAANTRRSPGTCITR